MTVPVEHITDALKLDSDAYTHLYEIQLYPTGNLYMCAERTITWQGHTYELWGLRLTGFGMNSDDQTSRPKFSLANFTYDESGNAIKGVFSALHAQGKIEGATIIRRRLLKTNADANLDIKEERRWKVSRIASERPDVVVLELRNSLDGPRFTMPARKFNPPEFSQVKLY